MGQARAARLGVRATMTRSGCTGDDGQYFMDASQAKFLGLTGVVYHSDKGWAHTNEEESLRNQGHFGQPEPGAPFAGLGRLYQCITRRCYYILCWVLRSQSFTIGSMGSRTATGWS